MVAGSAKEVDAYIANQAPGFQECLATLSRVIREEAPDAEELISYGVPGFRDSHMLVGFGVTRTACSLYTMSPQLVESMGSELDGIKHAGSTLHFDPGEALPEAVVRRIVRARRQENRERAALRSRKK